MSESLSLFPQPLQTDSASLEPVTIEMVTGMPHLRTEFEYWARIHQPTGRLDQVVADLIELDMVRTVKEGLEFLNEQSRTVSMEALALACCDIKNHTHRQPFRTLERILRPVGENPNTRNYSLYRTHGIVSHQAIMDLMRGFLPNYEAVRAMMETNPPAVRNLFGDTARQSFLFESRELTPGGNLLEEIRGNRISDWLVSGITRCWKEALAAIRNAGSWIEVYQKGSGFIPELQALLTPVFGTYVFRVSGYRDPFPAYLSLLTLLSWATAVVRIHYTGPGVFFCETPALDKSIRLGGWRIDNIEVVSINGKTPSGSERAQIGAMMRKRFPSVGYLIRQLERVIGKRFMLRIGDLKFAVGDGSGEYDVISAEDLIAPRPEHLNQIRQYLTLSALDEALIHGSCENVWTEDGHFGLGKIVYYLPNSPPITYEIPMTPTQQEEFFIQNTVQKLSGARQSALLRILNNHLLKPIIHKAEGRESNGRSTVVIGNGNRTSLFPEKVSDTRNGMLHTVIERYRASLFLDPDHIVESRGTSRKGEPKYALHLDRLLEVLDQGKIAVDENFDAVRGGFITCLNPEHEDENPSMYLYLEHGTAKCWVCGLWCFFEPTSIPKEYEVVIRESAIRHGTKQSQNVIIPDEHHRIMAFAQGVLNREFFGSRAERYVEEERCLDGRIAHELGAGFGNDHLIHALLDEKLSYGQLIHYGFVGLSHKVSTAQGICQLLFSRGLTLSDIRREILVGKKKSEQRLVKALPYSRLNGRVTFPMEYEGKNTNIYGRATWPCEKNKHWKLPRKYTRVPNGACGLSALQSPTHDEVIVVEAPLDRVNLALLGYEGIVAVVGGNNILTMEAIARSGKNVAIGYDNDKAGKDNTIAAIRMLQNAGHTGRIRDFMADFIAKHPEAGGHKDINAWWQSAMQMK